MTLADNVKKARNSAGLSQEALARKAGMSQAAIVKIEAGRTKQPRNLPAIARALGLSVTDLDPRLVPEAMAETAAPVTIPAAEVGHQDLPVYATTTTSTPGSVEGAFSVRFQSIIDYVPRPAPLVHIKDGYGFLVPGTAMQPIFKQRDVALIHPNMEPAEEDSVVLYSRAMDVATMGDLVEHTESEWIIRRYSPEIRQLTLPKSKWPVCHIVVAKYWRR